MQVNPIRAAILNSTEAIQFAFDEQVEAEKSKIHKQYGIYIRLLHANLKAAIAKGDTDRIKTELESLKSLDMSTVFDE